MARNIEILKPNYAPLIAQAQPARGDNAVSRILDRKRSSMTEFFNHMVESETGGLPKGHGVQDVVNFFHFAILGRCSHKIDIDACPWCCPPDLSDPDYIAELYERQYFESGGE